MRVLLTNCHSLRGIGGGQTAYRNLLANNPEIELTVLTSVQGGVEGVMPKGVGVLQLKQHLDSKIFYKKIQKKRTVSFGDLDDYVKARNIAETVRGMSFDVVEVPDYETFSRYLPMALEEASVSYGKIVLSLHGRISKTLSYEWDYLDRKESLLDLMNRESEAFSNSDVRYGLSEFYKRELTKEANLPIHLIDPFLCVTIPSVEQSEIKKEILPGCNFIGRLERRKGIEAYVDLVWALNKPELYSSAEIIGQDRVINNGTVSELVNRLSEKRGVDIRYTGPKTPEQMQSYMLHTPIVGCLPSIYDTFNLIALELLLCGHPVLIGKGAGCYEFLKKRYSDLPGYAVMDPYSPSLSAGKLGDFLESYHDIREELLNFFKENRPAPDKGELYSIYADSKVEYNSSLRNAISMKYYGYRSMEGLSSWNTLAVSQVKKIVDPVKVPMEMGKDKLTGLMSSVYDHFEQSLQKQLPYLFRNKGTLKSYQGALNKYALLKEETKEDILHKLERCHYFYDRYRYLNRFSLYQELARLHGKQGETELAVTYLLRCLRIPSNVSENRAKLVVQQLKSIGMDAEAEVAALKYGDHSWEDVRDYLDGRYNQLKTPPVNQFSDYIDQRSIDKPRVSIVVSVYNTQKEMFEKFIKLLSQFDMVRRNEVEIIIIDSGSDLPLSKNMNSLSEAEDLNYLLARTSKRETIQSAWNRGIVESKSPYLVFLGVDETIRCDALDILANYLDENSGVNWAMGNSVVTSVDKDGAFIEDVMFYNRKQFSRAATFFDCTFLSYVGGMYRKSLHDEHGYYDDTFRGAGDTEFKCRLFPYIRPAHIPETLGMFLNYPSARTTASSKIEIEDLRAWYIFRTKGGLRYLYKDNEIKEVEELVLFSLSGRRGYTFHSPESDCAMASMALDLIKDMGESSLLKYQEPLERLVHTMGDAEFFYNTSAEELLKNKVTLNESKKFFKMLAIELPNNNFPQNMLDDAYFFAHGWLWPTTQN